ncbi:MAG: flagellar hook-basal body complex protein FliE [Massilia sp.]|nr:flagellar hook-basal body complex protein FliE [Massilia sp.]
MSIGGIGGIDSSRIQAMMEQLKAAATKPAAGPVAPTGVPDTGGATKVSFSDALKSSLESVNASQVKAEELGQAFAAGDDKVSLSDVMISMQKASINMQATVQVRNKMVSAYHEIMNMQV